MSLNLKKDIRQKVVRLQQEELVKLLEQQSVSLANRRNLASV